MKYWFLEWRIQRLERQGKTDSVLYHQLVDRWNFRAECYREGPIP
jgi:hypothetical protein